MENEDSSIDRTVFAKNTVADDIPVPPANSEDRPEKPVVEHQQPTSTTELEKDDKKDYRESIFEHLNVEFPSKVNRIKKHKDSKDKEQDVTAACIRVIKKYGVRRESTVNRYKAALAFCIDAPTNTKRDIKIREEERSLAVLNINPNIEYDYRIIQAAKFFRIRLKTMHRMLLEVNTIARKEKPPVDAEDDGGPPKASVQSESERDTEAEESVNKDDLEMPHLMGSSAEEDDEETLMERSESFLTRPFEEYMLRGDAVDRTKSRSERIRSFINQLFYHVKNNRERECIDWMIKIMIDSSCYKQVPNCVQRAKILEYFKLALPHIHASDDFWPEAVQLSDCLESTEYRWRGERTPEIFDLEFGIVEEEEVKKSALEMAYERWNEEKERKRMVANRDEGRREEEEMGAGGYDENEMSEDREMNRANEYKEEEEDDEYEERQDEIVDEDEAETDEPDKEKEMSEYGDYFDGEEIEAEEDNEDEEEASMNGNVGDIDHEEEVYCDDLERASSTSSEYHSAQAYSDENNEMEDNEYVIDGVCEDVIDEEETNEGDKTLIKQEIKEEPLGDGDDAVVLDGRSDCPVSGDSKDRWVKQKSQMRGREVAQPGTPNDAKIDYDDREDRKENVVHSSARGSKVGRIPMTPVVKSMRDEDEEETREAVPTSQRGRGRPRKVDNTRAVKDVKTEDEDDAEEDVSKNARDNDQSSRKEEK